MASVGPTLDEARRAIYLDFEGLPDEEPIVLGTLWVSRQGQEPMFRQYLLDPTLRSLAVPPLGAVSLQGELRSLIGRAERQHRILVGWSGHELTVVRAHCPDLAPAFENVYRDAKADAKAWARLHELKLEKDARKRRHTLGAYEAAMHLSRDGSLGPKEMAKALRGARRAIEHATPLRGSRGDRWERMLVHNEIDCRAMREITLRALEDLGTRSNGKERRSGKRR